jgi:hypothetical protein
VLRNGERGDRARRKACSVRHAHDLGSEVRPEKVLAVVFQPVEDAVVGRLGGVPGEDAPDHEVEVKGAIGPLPADRRLERRSPIDTSVKEPPGTLEGRCRRSGS